MKIGVPRESAEGENRVALVPESVKSLLKKEGVEIVIESGAGDVAGHPDSQYEEAGAKVGSHADALAADLVLHVAPLSSAQIGELKQGQYLISHLSPLTSAETNNALASAGVTALAMELIPRTTRAQAMDALSSQATAAGYAATLIAARESGSFWGMLTTAAGTIRPARVLVLGAGVAGLQAIATAKRLGAIVTGFDIRRAAWEQIASLGGRPLELDFIPDAEDEGGYARPLTDEENQQVRDAIDANAAKPTPAHPAPGKPVDSYRAQPLVSRQASGATDASLRTPPRVLRLWVAPWEDADGDFHDQSYVYVVADPGRWGIEHNQKRIVDRYRPTFIQTGPAVQTQKPTTSSPQAPTSGVATRCRSGQVDQVRQPRASSSTQRTM